jgi:hypothetical protein
VSPSIAFALALAAAPPAECPTRPPRIGPADAPVTVRVYLDPVAPDSLAVWTRVRALVAQMEGDLAVEVEILRKPEQEHPSAVRPDEDRVRTLAAVAARVGALEPVLAEIDRASWEGIATRLARPDQRAALLGGLGVPDAPAKERCARLELVRTRARVSELQRLQLDGSPVRAPAFGILGPEGDELLVMGDPLLRELRPRIEATAQARRGPIARRVGAIELPPQPRPPPRDLGRVEGGLRIGGEGGPHHLLLYADGERDPTLSTLLPTALRLREQAPEVLSIQIVARGARAEAVELRRRLCAAARAGLEVEYLRALARGFSSAVDLPDHLDAVAEREKCPAGDRESNDRGGFLDGLPTNQEDLEALRLRTGTGARPEALPWFWRRVESL